MKLRLFGAASIVALSLAACAKNSEATAAVEEPVAAEDAASVSETIESAPVDVATETTDDVFTDSTVDIASVRSKADLDIAAAAVFAQADSDHDGLLTQSEFYALASMVSASAPETVIDSATETVGQVEDAAAAATESMPEMFASEATADAGDAASAPSADAIEASFAQIAGEDASLTAEDLRAAYLARFDAADVNDDAVLDDAEVVAFKAATLF